MATRNPRPNLSANGQSLLCRNATVLNFLKRIRYAILATVLVLAALGFVFVDAQFSLTGRPTVDMLAGLGLLNFFLYLWIRCLSDASAGWQFKTIAALVFGQVVLFASVQMEGIYGNGRPIFAWRWKPLPADQIAAPQARLNRATAITVAPVGTTDWPAFRGANRNGVSAARCPDWTDQHRPVEIWRQPIGAGWSSFAVVGEYAFTMEQIGDSECTTCLDLRTGHRVWLYRDAERFSEITGGEGPRSTPTFDDGYLYTLGATGVLRCLDARNGDPIWRVDILKQHQAVNCYYGMCGSPLVVNDLVIVSPGGKGASLVAYDKRNGNLVWAAGNAQASYASPQQMRLCGIEQVLNFNADGLDGHDLVTGKQLWHVPWISNPDERNNVCQPIQISDNQVFISSGYGQGCALLQINHDPSKGQFHVDTLWQNKRLRSKFASAVFDGQYIYGLDQGILVCIDSATGNRNWKQGRYYHGQIVLAGEHLIIQAEDGSIAQVRATSDNFVEIARIGALDQRTWTHPVLANKYLITRNDRQMVCFQLVESKRDSAADNVQFDASAGNW